MIEHDVIHTEYSSQATRAGPASQRLVLHNVVHTGSIKALEVLAVSKRDDGANPGNSRSPSIEGGVGGVGAVSTWAALRQPLFFDKFVLRVE